MVGFVVSIAMLQVQENPALRVPAWVEHLKERLTTEGVLVGYPDGLIGWHHGRPATRYEYAVATHASVMHLKEIVLEGEKHGITSEQQTTIAKWSSWAPACLLNLTDEFKRELASMGVEMPGFLKEISALKARMTKLRITDSFFADVPLGHWAAGAVTEMGKMGLLKGYPGKKFRGCR